MESLKKQFDELNKAITELETEEIIVMVREQLGKVDNAILLTELFLNYPNSRSHGLLIHCCVLFEKIRYEEVVQSMKALSPVELAAYHFAAYVPEYVGVDVKAAAQAIADQFPEGPGKMSVFLKQQHQVAPTKSTMETLQELGADPLKIWQSLQATGAPMMPLPAE